MSTLTTSPDAGRITLPPPALPANATLQQALAHRRSERIFAPAELPLPTLSSLLWAAFGINRREGGGRTAPSAHNWQEITIFAVLARGAYRYDAAAHALHLVKADDLRAATGVQDFVATAPLNLVYVADFARMHGVGADDQPFLAGADAGCIAQNVYLFCASAGLATVVRGLVDRRRLAAALGLSKSERVALTQSVGLPAPATAR